MCTGYCPALEPEVEHGIGEVFAGGKRILLGPASGADISANCIVPARLACQSVSQLGTGRMIGVPSTEPSQFLRPKDKEAVPAHLRAAARIPKNAEVVGVIQLDLRPPRGAADDAAAQRGEGVHLVPDAAV